MRREQLLNWIKENYEKGIINTITDDSFYVKLYGMTIVANEDYYVIYKDGQCDMCEIDLLEKNYEGVIE